MPLFSGHEPEELFDGSFVDSRVLIGRRSKKERAMV